MIVGQKWRYPPQMTHDHGPGRSPRPVGRTPRRWAGALGGVSRAAQCNDRESIDCRPRPWLSPLVPGLINCPRKKKIQQSLSESNAFVCGALWPAAAPGPGGSAGPGRRPGRRRAHTVAHGRRDSGETTPDAALCCCDGTVGRHTAGARRPRKAAGRAALAVSRTVSRAGRLPARAVTARALHGHCAEAALDGPETRRSSIPSRRG